MDCIVRKGACAREYGENNDGEGEGVHPAPPVGKNAEDVSAEDRAYQRIRGNHAAFAKRQAEFTDDGRHRKRKNQNVEPVHGVTDDRGPHDFPTLFASDSCFLKFQFFNCFLRHSTPPGVQLRIRKPNSAQIVLFYNNFTDLQRGKIKKAKDFSRP